MSRLVICGRSPFDLFEFQPFPTLPVNAPETEDFFHIFVINFLLPGIYAGADGRQKKAKMQRQGLQFMTGSLYREPLATNYCAFQIIIMVF